MKKIFKLLTGGFIAISATTAIVTPIEINAANARMNNNQTVSTSNIAHSEKIQTNSNSILSNISQKQIDNIINNFYTNNASKDTSMLLKQSTSSNKDQIIISKAKMIVNELYNNKISLYGLRNNVENKYNNLTIKQKEYIQNKIQQEEKHLNNRFNLKPLMFCYPTVFISQNQSNLNILTDINSLIENVIQNAQKILNQITGITIFASVLTALAIAATAIAAADWSELFVGWPEAAVTTAAMVADWITVGFAWSYYYQILNPMKNIISSPEFKIVKTIKYICTGIKTPNTVKKAVGWVSKQFKKERNTVEEEGWKLHISMDVDQGANDVSIWTDPENAEAGEAIGTAESLMTKIFGYINDAIFAIG